MKGRFRSLFLHALFGGLLLNTVVAVAADTILVTHTATRTSVTRGEMIPYTITLENTGAALADARLVDNIPRGFSYVSGSAVFDGAPLEPEVATGELSWDGVALGAGSTHTLQLLLMVESGISDGDRANQVQVFDNLTSTAVSSITKATVRITPDTLNDCTEIIGKVFDDRNLNGYPDPGEEGLPGVRLVTVRGLIATTDPYGRFHLTCAMVPNETRGSNFILKLDDRSLPSGYRLTTENPRVLRITRGKMSKFNFGATLHRVVRLDLADAVFEPGGSVIRGHWRPRVDRLLEELKKSPSVLRVSYLADLEDEGLVAERLRALKDSIGRQWEELDCCYRLVIETEVFWRRGGPPDRSRVIE